MFPFPQSQSLMQAYFAEREEERRELRRLVEAAGGQNAAKEARAQLQAMKKSIGESLAARKRGGGDKNSIGRARMGRDVSQSMQIVLCSSRSSCYLKPFSVNYLSIYELLRHNYVVQLRQYRRRAGL